MDDFDPRVPVFSTQSLFVPLLVFVSGFGFMAAVSKIHPTERNFFRECVTEDSSLPSPIAIDVSHLLREEILDLSIVSIPMIGSETFSLTLDQLRSYGCREAGSDDEYAPLHISLSQIP